MVSGSFWRFKVVFAWQAQAFWPVAKHVAGAGLREGCKNVGRRGWVEEAPKRCVSRGRPREFWLCDVDVWSLRKGCKFHVTEMLLYRDHFAWQLHDFVCLGSTFSWQAQYFWSIRSKIAKTYWNSEVECLVDVSFLKEVSQKCFVFDLQSLIFEGSFAEMLRFGASRLHFWRKPRRKALNLKSIDNQMAWISDQLTTTSLDVQINRQPKSFEAHISWQPNHLNLKSFDFQIAWISNQLTTNSLESQIDWQPNRLNLNSLESDINWFLNHLNSTRPLPIGSLCVETSATALCRRYVIVLIWIRIFLCFSFHFSLFMASSWQGPQNPSPFHVGATSRDYTRTDPGLVPMGARQPQGFSLQTVPPMPGALTTISAVFWVSLWHRGVKILIVEFGPSFFFTERIDGKETVSILLESRQDIYWIVYAPNKHCVRNRISSLSSQHAMT